LPGYHIAHTRYTYWHFHFSLSASLWKLTSAKFCRSFYKSVYTLEWLVDIVGRVVVVEACAVVEVLLLLQVHRTAHRKYGCG
jgi:hypothetical protein